MTPHQQETKRRAEVMLAYAEGKEITERPLAPRSIRFPVAEPSWNWERYEFEVAAPTIRPWGPEDVPPGCWVRLSDRSGTLLIVAFGSSWVALGATTAEPVTLSYLDLQQLGTWSTDLKTWKKPEVAV